MPVYNQNETLKEAFEKIVVMSNEITKTVIFLSSFLSVDLGNLILVDHKKVSTEFSDSRCDCLEANSCQNDLEESSERSVTSTTASGTDKDGHKKAAKAADKIREKNPEEKANSSTIDESPKLLDNEMNKSNDKAGKVLTIKQEYIEDNTYPIKLEPAEYEPFTIKQEVVEESIIGAKDLSTISKSENEYTLSDNVNENMEYLNKKAESFIKMAKVGLTTMKTPDKTHSKLESSTNKAPFIKGSTTSRKPAKSIHKITKSSKSPDKDLKKAGSSITKSSKSQDKDLKKAGSSITKSPKSHNKDFKKVGSSITKPSLYPTIVGSSLFTKPTKSQNEKASSKVGHSSNTEPITSPDKFISRVGPSSTMKPTILPDKFISRVGPSSTSKPTILPDKFISRVRPSSTTKPITSTDKIISRVRPSSNTEPITSPDKFISRVGPSSTTKPITSPDKIISRVRPSSNTEPITSPDMFISRVGPSSTTKPITSPDKFFSRLGSSSTVKPSPYPEKASFINKSSTSPNNSCLREVSSVTPCRMNNQIRNKVHHSGTKRPHPQHQVPPHQHPQYQQPHGFNSTLGTDKSYQKRMKRERVLSPLQNGEWRKKSELVKSKSTEKRSFIKNKVIQDLEEEDLKELIRIKKKELLSLSDVDVNNDTKSNVDVNLCKDGNVGGEDGYEVEEGEIV